MSEFDELLSAGFAEMIPQVGARSAGKVIVGENGREGDGIFSPLVKTKALRDSGLMVECESTLELTRAEAVKVGILTADGKECDRARIRVGDDPFIALVIENDYADPMVRAHLKRARG